MLSHTPTYLDILGFIAFSSSPSPWQPPIPHQKKKCVAPIIVLCIFTNTTAALSVHSNLPPRHHHRSLRHPSAHHHHCHHQHRITTTTITTTTATLHAMPRYDFEPFPFAASRAGDSVASEADHSSRYMDELLTAALSTKIPPHAAGLSALVPVPPPRYRRPPSALALASKCSSPPSSPPGTRPDSLPMLKNAMLLMVRWW